MTGILSKCLMRMIVGSQFPRQYGILLLITSVTSSIVPNSMEEGEIFMHHYTFNTKKDRRSIFPFHLLVPILIALQLMLPSAAFASTSAPPASFSFGTNQALDRASVSIVRLVAAYALTVGTLTPPQCTGLGVLIKSWKASGDADLNNWVLTDGSLVNPTAAICPGQPNQQLRTIQVLANNTYTANAPAQSLLGTFTIS